jgi:hypothetical protein
MVRAHANVEAYGFFTDFGFVHIERAFARVKQFQFLGKAVSIKQAGLIGKMF